MILKYDWLYERSGYWTRLDAEDGRIEFALGRNHYAGAVVGGLFFASVFAGILMAPTGNRIWFFPIFIALLPFTLYSGFKRTRERYSHLPIVLSKDPKGIDSGTEIPFSIITRLLVRENVGRQHDDTGLAQLYAICKDLDSPLLLYQHYLARKDLVLETGANVAMKLNVKLDNEL